MGLTFRWPYRHGRERDHDVRLRQRGRSAGAPHRGVSRRPTPGLAAGQGVSVRPSTGPAGPSSPEMPAGCRWSERPPTLSPAASRSPITPRHGGTPCPPRHHDWLTTSGAMPRATSACSPTLQASADAHPTTARRVRKRPGVLDHPTTRAGTTLSASTVKWLAEHPDAREVVCSVWTMLTELERAGQHPGGPSPPCGSS